MKVAFILLITLMIIIISIPVYDTISFFLNASDNKTVEFNAHLELISNIIPFEKLIIATIGVLFTFFAILLPFLLGWIRKPNLSIEIGDSSFSKPDHRFLNLIVFNNPLRIPLRYIENRDTAINCKVDITYTKDGDYKPVFPKIVARWNEEPEPLQPIAIGNVIQLAVATALIPLGQVHNLEASENGSPIALAIKYDNEFEAYAFNSFSYYYPSWKNPKWKLETGEYIIQTIVKSGQFSMTKKFRLINRGISLNTNFQLEPIIEVSKFESIKQKVKASAYVLTSRIKRKAKLALGRMDEAACAVRQVLKQRRQFIDDKFKWRA
jgi:hypothetical protein